MMRRTGGVFDQTGPDGTDPVSPGNGDTALAQGRLRPAAHTFGVVRQQAAAGKDRERQRLHAGLLADTPDIAGDLHRRRAAADHADMHRALRAEFDNPLPGRLQALDGLDRKNIVQWPVDHLARYLAAQVAGQDIVGDRLTGIEQDLTPLRIDSGHHGPNERAALLFRDGPGGKAYLLGPIGTAEHAGSHPGIVVIIRGPDYRHLAAPGHELAETGQGHHMRMTAAGNDQTLFHGSSRLPVLSANSSPSCLRCWRSSPAMTDKASFISLLSARSAARWYKSRACASIAMASDRTSPTS